MKNAFAYRDDISDGSVFISRSPEGGLATKKKDSDRNTEAILRHAALPKILQVVFLIVLIAGLLLFTVGLNLLTDEDYTGDITVAIVLASVGGGLIVVGLGFMGIAAVKAKRVMGSPAFAFYEGEREKLLRELGEALAIPAEAVKCDVFICFYQTVRSKQKRRPYFKNGYIAHETTVWREGEAFCIFDGDDVYKFPYENVIETERIEKRVIFYGWNKKEKFNKGKFKQYKIRYNGNADYYTVKPSYRVRLFRESEEYEVLVPGYETEILEKLIGKTLP